MNPKPKPDSRQSMTIPQALQIALQHHEAGRLAEAEALYRQILFSRPDRCVWW
jgi:hypothetical protein